MGSGEFWKHPLIVQCVTVTIFAVLSRKRDCTNIMQKALLFNTNAVFERHLQTQNLMGGGYAQANEPCCIFLYIQVCERD